MDHLEQNNNPKEYKQQAGYKRQQTMIETVNKYKPALFIYHSRVCPVCNLYYYIYTYKSI